MPLYRADKTFKTKFATGEKFTITTIRTNRIGVIVDLRGVFEFAPHLGECPLSPERLIPEKIETGFIEVCDKCGNPVENFPFPSCCKPIV